MLTGENAKRIYHILVTKGYLLDCLCDGDNQLCVYTLSNNGTVYAYTVRMKGDDVIYVKSVVLEHLKLAAKNYMDRSGDLCD